MKNKILICLLFMSIAGCYPHTIEKVRERKTASHTFYMDTNYQEAYREVLDVLRTTGRFFVEGDLYTDINKGYITVSGLDILLGRSGIYYAVEIIKVTENKTEVISYTSSAYAFKASVKCVEKLIKKKKEKRKRKEEQERAGK